MYTANGSERCTLMPRFVHNVVVVDDSATSLFALRDVVEGLPNAAAHGFGSSLECLDWCAHNDADCFVLDFHMIAPNGLEMTRRLRADPRHHDIPIIIVTGDADLGMRTEVLVAGANDFVRKPVFRDELKARLTTLLALRDAHKLVAMHVEELEHSLVESEERARRLEALWKIANNPSLNAAEVIDAMLHQAAEAIRPGEPFCALLGRIEFNEVVAVAVATTSAATHVPAVGDRRPVAAAGTVNRLQAGRTRAWNDLIAEDPEAQRAHRLGWKSVLATQFLVADATYSLTFASSMVTAEPFASEDFAYAELIGAFFAHQLQVDALEAVLRDSEERSREHAERLEALSGIVNNPRLHEEELLLAMLCQGSASIRRGQEYFGALLRIDGDALIVEAIINAPFADPASRLRWSVGSTIPLAETIVGKLIGDESGARCWDERELDDLAGPLGKSARWRCYIATTFVAGGTTHALAFASNHPPKKPFGSQDLAYVDVLASFFANRLQQNWQFDRIQYQQSHDVLTGLLNRSQFRSQARLTNLQTNSDRYALVLVDINGFRTVNATYGHMIGDALLVEVAASLRARTREDEFAGRLGGDVFAIFVPNPQSRAEAERRAHDFLTAFSQPFSTGDRHGKEFIGLTTSIGVAVAPDDAPDLDAIFSLAHDALMAAKKRGPGSVVDYAALGSAGSR
jgi:diguanylate cyclase (GGDEF)-like protein